MIGLGDARDVGASAVGGSSARSRVVVLGGYGAFGARICRALARRPGGEVWVAGRRLERARSLAAELEAEGGGCVVRGLDVDVEDPKLVYRLGGIAPTVVVDTAGPFQARDYRVAEACLACRSHYIDLADARDFVTNFPRQLDREARRRRLFLVSGASSLPGISSAVVDALAADMASVRAIETAIAPAGRSPRGEATVAAVLSYCGKPFETLERGARRRRFGWQDSRSIDFDVFERRVAACDVPDLELFPARYPGVESVTFHAGPEPLWQHASLWLMAAAVRAGLVRDWSRHARTFARAGRWAERLGSEVGAMRVVVTGLDASGAEVVRIWNLVARANHGAWIPCVPAIVLAKKLLSGEIREHGARACVGLVDLDELALELEPLDISWRTTERIA